MIEKIKKVVNSKRNQICFVVILILLTIFACYPYINRLPLYGHDLSFHLNRIIGMADGLKEGEFPVVINANNVDGMGYGNSLFYPEIFLYIPAILTALGAHPLLAYKIFIILITMVTFVTMYISAKKIFNSNKIGILASLLYTFSLYRLEDVFVRAALGEILAFAFLPLVILGLYEIIYNDKRRWYILTIGIWGIANSHMISFVMALGVILFFVVINFKKFIKDKSRIKTLVICGIVSILVCFGTLIPMMEQVLNTDYVVSTGGTAYWLDGYTANITKLFENTLHPGQMGDSDYSLEGVMNIGIGTLLLIIPVCVIFCTHSNKEKKTFITQLIVFGFICVIMTSKLFPWPLFQFMNIIQFPFRINMFSTVALSIVSAYVLYNISEHKKEVCVFTSIILIYISGIQLENPGCIQEDISYQELIGDLPVGAGEYLPVGFEKSSVVTNTEKTIEYEYSKNRGKIEIDYNENNKAYNGKLIFPLTYYKGYTAYVIDSDNRKTYLEVLKSDTGTVLIDNSSQVYGIIKVEYKLTVVQIGSYIVTILSLLCLGIYVIKNYMKDFRTKKLKEANI